MRLLLYDTYLEEHGLSFVLEKNDSCEVLTSPGELETALPADVCIVHTTNDPDQKTKAIFLAAQYKGMVIFFSGGGILIPTTHAEALRSSTGYQGKSKPLTIDEVRRRLRISLRDNDPRSLLAADPLEYSLEFLSSLLPILFDWEKSGGIRPSRYSPYAIANNELLSVGTGESLNALSKVFFDRGLWGDIEPPLGFTNNGQLWDLLLDDKLLTTEQFKRAITKVRDGLLEWANRAEAK